jgi:hypothetical protein
VKGTEIILGAFDEMQADGLLFNVRLLESLPNREVIKELTDADILVDQLYAPTYSMLSLEGMATGCAVAGGNHLGCEPIPPSRPVLHIDPSNVRTQLERLITDKDLRKGLAARGRPFVEKYHDHVAVARRMLAAVTEPESAPCEHRPTFYSQLYRLPEGVMLSPGVLHLTDEVIRRWGLPADVDLAELKQRGLVGSSLASSAPALPRWDVSRAQASNGPAVGAVGDGA